MDEHIFIDKYPVGDGGYELGETIDDVICVDNIDHSADFLNPPYLNTTTLICDPRMGNTFSVNEQTLTKYREKLKEELRRIGYVSGNRLVEVLNDVFETERPETVYGDKQGILFIDEKAFDYTFTGSEGLIEKMEPTKPVYDISWIRKRMKCCKNPMERKMLEKQLNEAYKARKKARKKR